MEYAQCHLKHTQTADYTVVLTLGCFRLQKEEPPHSPRLFECSNQVGQFRMTEVDDFAQSDLDEEDVMLLDTWEEVRRSDGHQSVVFLACRAAYRAIYHILFTIVDLLFLK